MVEAAKREDAALPSLVIAYFQQDIEAITEDLKFTTVEEIDCISCKVRYELYNVPCEEHGGPYVTH